MAKRTIKINATIETMVKGEKVIKAPGEPVSVNDEAEAERLIEMFGEWGEASPAPAGTSEAVDQLKGEVKSLTDEKSKAEAERDEFKFLAGLNDATKAHYLALDNPGKLAFKKMDDKARQEAIDAA